MLCTRYKTCSCTVRGKYLFLGLLPLANPSSSNLLSQSSALHFRLSDGNLQGKTEVFLRKPGNSVLHTCQVGFASEEGCMGFLAIVLRRLWACCFFPMPPWVHRCFRRLMSLEVWSINWIIIYVSVEYGQFVFWQSSVRKPELFYQTKNMLNQETQAPHCGDRYLPQRPASTLGRWNPWSYWLKTRF